MKVNIKSNTLPSQNTQSKVLSGGTFVSPNLKKTSIFIDKDGNQIDPRTKQIIKKNSDK